MATRFTLPPRALAYSPTGMNLAAGGDDEGIKLIDVASGRVFRSLPSQVRARADGWGGQLAGDPRAQPRGAPSTHTRTHRPAPPALHAFHSLRPRGRVLGLHQRGRLPQRVEYGVGEAGAVQQARVPQGVLGRVRLAAPCCQRDEACERDCACAHRTTGGPSLLGAPPGGLAPGRRLAVGRPRHGCAPRACGEHMPAAYASGGAGTRRHVPRRPPPPTLQRTTLCSTSA